MPHKYTNNLIKESSPYLLQHAHNPVQWEAWHPAVLERAKKEQKLILISIGYAACHWCHVMEHECFEDEEVAKTMNAHFVNIKIDREERPDIDHIYMDALQMMTGSGGWPLNILALPDGRPFWGATFVKKDAWIQVLNQLQEVYKSEPEKIMSYANNMAEGLQEINGITLGDTSNTLKIPELKGILTQWYTYFDTFLGGYKRAPKFMMPVNLNFLLHYATYLNDAKIQDYVDTTLTRMAWGGIFDHVGGGFSRYSVDTKWHVPHFEKMLYDNALLISLYAKAYAATKNELYKHVVKKSISFLEEELKAGHGGFYSSLDADSLTVKGTLKEGAYYVWKEKELEHLLEDQYPIFSDYFNINSYGYWEDGDYVLIRDGETTELAQKHNISEAVLEKNMTKCLGILKKEREIRNKPRLDDKILTSWNGLALKGLTDAYRFLEDEHFLELALKNANFIERNVMEPNGKLYHNHKNGKSSITGFLEDYAAVIDGFLGLYEVTFNETWLNHSLKLTNYVISNFSDDSTGLFYFTSNEQEQLIRKTLEVADNVIPSSNSIMAHNLLKLSNYFPEENFDSRLGKIMDTMKYTITKNPQSHANWLDLSLLMNTEFYEIAICGKEYRHMSQKLKKHYLPNVIFAGSEANSEVPLLKNRYVQNKTLVYVCTNGTCQLPVESPGEALHLIRSEF